MTSIRGLLKKPEVKMQAHSKVQLMALCFPVNFQGFLPKKREVVGIYFASCFIDQRGHYRDQTFQCAASYIGVGTGRAGGSGPPNIFPSRVYYLYMQCRSPHRSVYYV